MFSWLWSWFQSPNRSDVYKPSQRLIYSYWNGSRIVKVDPMVLYKKIVAKGPEISVAIKIANSISKAAPKGHEDVIKSVREIFAVGPYESPPKRLSIAFRRVLLPRRF